MLPPGRSSGQGAVMFKRLEFALSRGNQPHPARAIPGAPASPAAGLGHKRGIRAIPVPYPIRAPKSTPDFRGISLDRFPFAQRRLARLDVKLSTILLLGRLGHPQPHLDIMLRAFDADVKTVLAVSDEGVVRTDLVATTSQPLHQRDVRVACEDHFVLRAKTTQHVSLEFLVYVRPLARCSSRAACPCVPLGLVLGIVAESPHALVRA